MVPSFGQSFFSPERHLLNVPFDDRSGPGRREAESIMTEPARCYECGQGASESYFPAQIRRRPSSVHNHRVQAEIQSDNPIAVKEEHGFKYVPR